MSKAQTDVVAALRIELDATKAALAKAREDLSHALHSLDETKQCCEERRTQTERAEKAERDLERDDREAWRQVDVVRRERDEARADVAAHSAPCSECKCQMRVCMDCAEAALAALRVELAEARSNARTDQKELVRLVEQRDSLRERLGDAKRVIEVAREYAQPDRSYVRVLRDALAEFDAKWGKR